MFFRAASGFNVTMPVSTGDDHEWPGLQRYFRTDLDRPWPSFYPSLWPFSTKSELGSVEQVVAPPTKALALFFGWFHRGPHFPTSVKLIRVGPIQLCTYCTDLVCHFLSQTDNLHRKFNLFEANKL